MRLEHLLDGYLMTRCKIYELGKGHDFQAVSGEIVDIIRSLTSDRLLEVGLGCFEGYYIITLFS